MLSKFSKLSAIFKEREREKNFVMCRLQRMANAPNLEQLIKDPTRIMENSRSLIDLIFASSSHHLSDHGIIHLSSSDHSMVYCVVKVGMKKAPGRIIEYRSFKSYDIGNFINDLKCIDWTLLDNNP